MGRRPFRLTAPIPPEKDFHENVADMLTTVVLPPAQWASYPAGHVPLPAEWAVKLYRMGLRRGWPDFLIIHNARVHGIELKTDGGELSRDRMVRSRRGGLRLVEGQRSVFPRLIAAGMPIAVCKDVSEVITALGAWGIPTRIREVA